MTLNGPIVHYLESASTQIEAKKTLNGVHWTTKQTAGKGRFDRQWYAEPGRSLAVSIAFPEYRGFAKPYLISMWICLAIAEEFDLGIQWPNDLVLNRKKVCGVLTEVVEGVPVVGFGINVGRMNFPIEIADRASSLANEGRLVGTPIEVLERIILKINEIEPVPQNWQGMDEKWRRFDETPGKIFKLQDGRVGVAEGISEDGELIWNNHGEYEMVTCADALWGFNSIVETN
jgi:BirA family biotin operon repressor/biotin-[acetyl-CoA-carboxylase] ligase